MLSSKKIKKLEKIIFWGTTVRLPTNISTLQLNLPPASPSIKNILEKEKFDILHFHELVRPFLSWEILSCSTSLNIATFHSAWHGGFSLALYRQALKPLEKWN